MGELRNRFAKNVDAFRLERLKMRELLSRNRGRCANTLPERSLTGIVFNGLCHVLPFPPRQDAQKQKTHLPVSLTVGFASTRLELDF